MPATTQKALLEITQKEFSKLETLLHDVTEDEALRKSQDDISIKDIIAHRAHWLELFFGWYQDGQDGLDVNFPAPGYKWNELTRYNADLRARLAHQTWQEACGTLRDAHTRLVDFISAHSDSTLYGGPMKGGKNHWTTGRWAEASGPSHYRSASKYIRAQIKQIRDKSG